jgi:hypothetical protein
LNLFFVIFAKKENPFFTTFSVPFLEENTGFKMQYLLAMKIDSTPYVIELNPFSQSNLQRSEFDCIIDDHHSSIFKGVQYELKILKHNEICKNILINGLGKYTPIQEHTFAFDHNHLVICCGNKVFGLNFPELTLDWVIQPDPVACHQIFKISNGFIIHGEIWVRKINILGEVEWQHEFDDIIGDIKENPSCFQIHNDTIEVHDFSDNVYMINFEGRLLEKKMYKHANLSV